MFRFPTDHEGRSAHSLTSQPLRHQVSRKIQEQLHERLREHLPPYMIPRLITVLPKMPVNENGKVDRQALAN
ncbi:hypothetical protein EDB80DRAFT_703439 [Ilyonectria destructans]|nr:hypothetical protein EDB80DRAFT_703439 [Ilyonectria destructans]